MLRLPVFRMDMEATPRDTDSLTARKFARPCAVGSRALTRFVQPMSREVSGVSIGVLFG